MFKKFLNSRKSAQWLQLLFCSQLLSLCITILSYMLREDWISWVNRGVSLLSVVCLLALASAQRGYRWAAVCKGISLCILVASAVVLHPVHIQKLMVRFGSLDTVTLWLQAANLLAAVFSVLALLCEYLTHGKLIPAMKKSWFILLSVTLALTVLGFVWSFISAKLVAMGSLSIIWINGMSCVIIGINRIMDVVYLWNLHRTAAALASHSSN